MSTITPDQHPQFIEASAALMNALCNASRLQILTILSEREISVRPLGELVGLTQSALSQHLAKLRAARLVTTRRDSTTVYYRCESPAVAKILAMLSGFFDPAEHEVTEAA